MSETKRSRILIISRDTLGEKVAGPAIRALSMARALIDSGHEVVLSCPNWVEGLPQGFEDITVAPFRSRCRADDRFARALAESDVVIMQAVFFGELPEVNWLDKFIVVDLYCPFLLENLASNRALNFEADYGHLRDLEFLREHLCLGDFFVCANERQRDFWLGMLALSGRITEANFSLAQDLRKLIDIVPFGISDVEPQHTARVLKGKHRAIKPTDKLIIWGGGIFNWLDPFTPIRAMRIVASRRDDVKLFFLGTKHPNPEIPEQRNLRAAIALAQELDLLGAFVLFNDRGYVPYVERQNFLLEANVGISSHPDHIESHFACRTRILDYIWAELPIICSDGDPLAELVARHKLGITVRPEDPEAMAQAILELVDDRERLAACKRRLRELKPQFYWRKVLKPLLDYCSEPYHTSGRRLPRDRQDGPKYQPNISPEALSLLRALGRVPGLTWAWELFKKFRRGHLR